jgi:hypothetical protein
MAKYKFDDLDLPFPPIIVPEDATPEPGKVANFIAQLWLNQENPFLREDERKAAQDLQEYGVAVVPNIVTKGECEATLGNFWTALDRGSSGRLHRPESADDLKDFRFGASGWPMNKHGIFEQGGFAHLPFIYKLRSEQASLTSLFSALYGCQAHQLVVSPDRLNFQLPTEWLPLKTSHWNFAPPTKLGQAQASWLHVDQAVSKPGRHCIQGLVTYTAATQPGDASFECVVGSHLVHRELERILGRKFNPVQRHTDWFKFSDEDKQRLDEIIEFDQVEHASGRAHPTQWLRKNIPYFDKFQSTIAEAGSAILWDSRLAHQGGAIRSSPSQPRDNPSNPRLVGYYCAQPFWAGADALPVNEYKKKVKIFAQHASAAHWPLKTKIFDKPRTYGKAEPVFDWAKICAPMPVARTLAAQFFGLGRAGSDESGILCLLKDQLPPARPPLLEFHATSGVRHPTYKYKEEEEEKIMIPAHDEPFWPKMRYSVNERKLALKRPEPVAPLAAYSEDEDDQEESKETKQQDDKDSEAERPKKRARKD